MWPENMCRAYEQQQQQEKSLAFIPQASYTQ
jgi:hypothetical protein